MKPATKKILIGLSVAAVLLVVVMWPSQADAATNFLNQGGALTDSIKNQLQSRLQDLYNKQKGSPLTSALATTEINFINSAIAKSGYQVQVTNNVVSIVPATK